MNEKARLWRVKNKERVREYNKQYYADTGAEREAYRTANWAASRLHAARKRAKTRGLPCTITEDDIKELGLPEVCPYLGVPLITHSHAHNNPNTVSLDCIIPELGYVPGNIELISLRANVIKNDGSAEEHQKIADRLRQLTASQ